MNFNHVKLSCKSLCYGKCVNVITGPNISSSFEKENLFQLLKL